MTSTNKDRANATDPVVAYTNMLLCTVFLLLLINPVLVMTHNMDGRSQRAADVKTKTTKVETTTNKDDSDNQRKEHVKLSTTTSSGHINCSLPKYKNSTMCKDDDGMVDFFLKKMSSNSGMLFRTMYVLLAVTGVVIIYFVIKAIRVRRRRSKSRKYGIITKQGDHGDMEMEPLGDGADEDDDYTVFEMSRRK